MTSLMKLRMPENALIDDDQPTVSQPVQTKDNKDNSKRDPKKAAAATAAPSANKKTESGKVIRRMSIPGLLANNNKNNCKKERKTLLGRLSDDLEYLEGLLQVRTIIDLYCISIANAETTTQLDTTFPLFSPALIFLFA